MRAAPSRRTPGRFGIALCLGALPAVLAEPVLGRAVALHELAAGADPYFQPAHAGLLYLAVPLVSLSTFLLFLAPGLLLVRGSSGAGTPAGWLLRGFGAALAVAMVETVAAARVWPGVAAPGGFATWALGILAILVVVRGRRSPPANAEGPTGQGAGWWPFLLLAALVAGLLLVLLPKFLWEDFNGDGIHGFLASRLLLFQPWPFWGPDVGPLAAFPGVTSMLFTWPNAWFLRVMGESEVAVRLPMLLYLAVAGAAIVAVAEVGRRPVPRAGWAVVGGGLVAYTLAMAFSASYNPYHADLALPGVQDTLLMVCFLGWVHALLRREWAPAVAWGLATMAALPSGLLLMGFWVLGHGVAARGRPWRDHLTAAVIVAVCACAAAGLPLVLSALGMPAPGAEYAGGSVLRYLEYLQVTDVRRFAYWAVPAGLFPALVLAWWRGQDAVARGLTLACLAYVGFFYVQAYVSLHHFVPAMILPAAVAARSIPEDPRGASRYLVAWAVLAAAAILLAVPESFRLHTSARDVGRQVGQQLGDFRRADPGVLRAGSLLREVAPPDWDLAVPSSSYGGSPYVWLYYGRHGEAARSAPILLLPAGADTAGLEVVARSDEALLAVRDRAIIDSVRALRPATDVGSRFLSVPRGILFRGHPLENGPRIVALEDLRRRLTGWFARDRD